MKNFIIWFLIALFPYFIVGVAVVLGGFHLSYCDIVNGEKFLSITSLWAFIAAPLITACINDNK